MCLRCKRLETFSRYRDKQEFRGFFSVKSAPAACGIFCLFVFVVVLCVCVTVVSYLKYKQTVPLSWFQKLFLSGIRLLRTESGEGSWTPADISWNLYATSAAENVWNRGTIAPSRQEVRGHKLFEVYEAAGRLNHCNHETRDLLLLPFPFSSRSLAKSLNPYPPLPAKINKVHLLWTSVRFDKKWNFLKVIFGDQWLFLYFTWIQSSC